MSSSDTTHRLFRSTGAATFSQVWRVGVTFGVYLLLRRFIVKADWGLADWALAIFMVLGALRDLGLLYHVIRVKPRPYGNLLLVELVWGSALAVLSFLSAELIARAQVQPHPDVVPVIRVLSLFLILDGLSVVPRTFFDAELQVGRTVLPEILRNLVYAVVSITLALLGKGIWSLVIAQVASVAVYTLLLWVRAWGHIPLHFARGQTFSLLRHSMPLAAIWFLAILIARVDPLILARRFPNDIIGVYGFAYFTALLVTATLVPAITRTLYPALVDYKEEPARLLEAYRLATLIVVAVEAPAAAFLFVNTEISLWLLGGDQWIIGSAQSGSAIPFLKVLCFTPLIDPFSRLGGEVLKTYHKDRIWILATILTLLSFIVFGWLFTGWFGPIGMAWANFLQLGGVVMVLGLYRIGPAAIRTLFGNILWLYFVALLPFGLAWFLARDHDWLRFALSIAAAVTTFAIYYRKFGGSFIRFFKPATAVSSTSP